MNRTGEDSRDTTPEPPEKGGVSSQSGRMKPFPVEALPKVVRAYAVESAEAIGVDVSMVAAPILATLGAAIGTIRAVVVKKGWIEFPCLWVAMIAESGAAKSPALDAATGAIVRRHQQQLAEFLEAKEGFEREHAEWKKAATAAREKGEEEPPEPMEPKERHLFVGDCTMEALAGLLASNPRGLISIQDELSGLFGRTDQYRGGKGSDREHYLSMYSQRPLKVDRKGIGSPPVLVPRPFLSIVGAGTPRTMREKLSEGNNGENGVAARFLIFNPPRSLRKWSDAEVSDSTLTSFNRLIDALFMLSGIVYPPSGKEGPKYIGYSSGAKREWQSWFNAHNAEAVKHGGVVAGLFSKLEAVCARLCLIMELASDPDSLKIHVRTVKRAIRIVEWFKAEGMRWHEAQAEAMREARLHQLSLWIGTLGGTVSARQLMREGPSPRPKSEKEAVAELSALEMAGRGEWEAVEPGPTGGRPTRRFILRVCDETPETLEEVEVVSQDEEGDSDDEGRVMEFAEGLGSEGIPEWVERNESGPVDSTPDAEPEEEADLW